MVVGRLLWRDNLTFTHPSSILHSPTARLLKPWQPKDGSPSTLLGLYPTLNSTLNCDASALGENCDKFDLILIRHAIAEERRIDYLKPIESSPNISQSSRNSLKAINSSALRRKRSGPVLGASRPHRRPSRERVSRVSDRGRPRSHPRLDLTCLNAIAAAEFPLILVAMSPGLPSLQF